MQKLMQEWCKNYYETYAKTNAELVQELMYD